MSKRNRSNLYYSKLIVLRSCSVGSLLRRISVLHQKKNVLT